MDNFAPELRLVGYVDYWEAHQLCNLMDFANGINAPKERYGKGRKMISVLDILDLFRNSKSTQFVIANAGNQSES